MRSVGKAISPIAQSLGGLINRNPGALGAAIGGAFGDSGVQGTQKTAGTWASNQNTTGATTNKVLQSGEQTAIEDPTMGAFRKNLIPQMQQMIHQAGLPLYGEAEKAGYLNNLNDLAADATKSLSSTLAARGISDSGAAAEGYGGIEGTRLAEASKFFGQIPAMNKQYADQQKSNLMGMATSWAGRAPTSYKTTGTTDESGTSQSTVAGQGSNDQKVTTEGPSIWKVLAGNIGGLLGNAEGGNPSTASSNQPTTLIDLFKKRKSSTPTGISMGDPLGDAWAAGRNATYTPPYI